MFSSTLSEKELKKTKQLRKSLSVSTTRPSSLSESSPIATSASSSSLVRAPSPSIPTLGSALSEGSRSGPPSYPGASGEAEKPKKKKKGLVSKILSASTKRLKGLGKKKHSAGVSDSSGATTGSDDYEPSVSRTFINAEGEEEPSVTLYLRSPKHIDTEDGKISSYTKTDEKDDEESSRSGANPAAISPRKSALKQEKEQSKTFNFVGALTEEQHPENAKATEIVRESSDPKPEDSSESIKREVRFAAAEVTIESPKEEVVEVEESVITTPRHLELISPQSEPRRPRSESAIKVQVIKEKKTLDRDFVVNCIALALDHCKVIESTVQAIEHEHDVDAKYRLKRKRTSLLRFVVDKKYEFLTADSKAGMDDDSAEDKAKTPPAETRTFRGFAFGDDDDEEDEEAETDSKLKDDREVDVSNFSKAMLKSWISQLAPKLQGAIDDETDSIVEVAVKASEEYSIDGGLKPFMEIFQALERIQKKL